MEDDETTPFTQHSGKRPKSVILLNLLFFIKFISVVDQSIESNDIEGTPFTGLSETRNYLNFILLLLHCLIFKRKYVIISTSHNNN